MEKEPKNENLDKKQTLENIKALLSSTAGRRIDLIVMSPNGKLETIKDIIVEEVKDDKVFVTSSDKDGTVKSTPIEISLIKEASIGGKTKTTIRERLEIFEQAFEQSQGRPMTQEEKDDFMDEFEDTGFKKEN